MNLHEFQGKALFAEYDLPVSNGKVIYDADDALKACRDIGGSKWVVKAQVHAGGRGSLVVLSLLILQMTQLSLQKMAR